MIFDNYSIEEIDRILNDISQMLLVGRRYVDINKKFPIKDFEEFYDIAYARKENEKIKEDIYFRKADLRFATNSDIAQYRAERLKCNLLVEIGAGIGVQTIAFSKVCKKVVAIELDLERFRFLEQNIKRSGIKNVELIHGDGLEFLKRADQADIIFCDPERVPHEEVRNVENFSPSIPGLIESAKTKNIAIELPPQIQSIPFDCEKEFISYKGELNRLTVYLGKLKKCERSAYLLPEHQKIANGGLKLAKAKKPLSYLYELNEAVVKAGLCAEAVSDYEDGFFLWDDNFITSKNKALNVFFKNSYKVLCISKHQDILENLRKHNAKSVVLRGSIPQEKYWKIRTGIEKKLNGIKKLTMILKEKEAIIMERL